MAPASPAGKPGPASALVSVPVGGAAGMAITRNGQAINVLDGAYDAGGGRIRGPVGP